MIAIYDNVIDHWAMLDLAKILSYAVSPPRFFFWWKCIECLKEHSYNAVEKFAL